MTQMNTDNDPETYAIIGAGMEVHSHLGRGFLENPYDEALAIELSQRGVPFQREVQLPVQYRGIVLPCSYRVDFLCYQDIIVELKALDRLSNIERAQVLNYLKARNGGRGLLLNFGGARLEYERFIL
jgi:GxxExxY protein